MKQLLITLWMLGMLLPSMLSRKAMKVFDAFAMRHKRKLTMVDTYGNIILHKYCILHGESLEHAIRAQAHGWPNLYMHHFLWEESPDGPSSHSHSGTTLSFLWRGQYWERYQGALLHRKRWSFNLVKFPQVHKIERVQRDTWTLFIRWFVRDSEIRIVPETCETVCDWCQKNVEGSRCFNAGKEFTYDAYAKQFDSKKPEGMKFPMWHYAGAETDAFIERRRRAMARLGRRAPVGTQEQLRTGQQHSKLPLILAQDTDSPPCRK